MSERVMQCNAVLWFVVFPFRKYLSSPGLSCNGKVGGNVNNLGQAEGGILRSIKRFEEDQLE